MKRIIALAAVLLIAGTAIGQHRGGGRNRGPGPRPGYDHSLVGFLVRCGLDIAYHDCICNTHHVSFDRCWQRHARWERHVGWRRPPARRGHDRHGNWDRRDGCLPDTDRGQRGGGHRRRGRG